MNLKVDEAVNDSIAREIEDKTRNSKMLWDSRTFDDKIYSEMRITCIPFIEEICTSISNAVADETSNFNRQLFQG